MAHIVVIGAGIGGRPAAYELRGKLEPHGVALRSIRGFGYRLELQAQ